MITELTKEQESQIEVYREKFLKRGLSTERLDLEKATQAVLSLYETLGLKKNEDFETMVFDSPQAMCEFAAKEAGGSPTDYVSKINYGNVENYWVSFYSYINNVLGITKEEQKVRVAEQVTEHCGPFLMFDGGILFSQCLTKIVMLSDMKTLHCDDGPAIDHADGLSRSWRLNGVEVTEKIVMTRPEDFTKEDILNEKNADVRREIVRKIPASVLLTILEPKVLDEESGYSLLGVDLGDNRVRPFLKMENPSINTVHIEGVSPNCKTVHDAICFRNGLSEFSLPKTLDGGDFGQGTYHQQGDALFFPIDLLPSDATATESNVAAEGLVRHIAKNAVIFETPDKRRFIQVETQSSIDHPEHKATLLEKGDYEIKKVLEYDHWLEESREVID